MNILVLCANDETVENQQWKNFLPKKYLNLKNKVYYTGLDITEDVSNNIHKKSITEFNKYKTEQFDFIINEFCMDSLNIDIYNLINKKLKTNGYYIDVAMITDEIEIYDKDTRKLKNIFLKKGSVTKERLVKIINLLDPPVKLHSWNDYLFAMYPKKDRKSRLRQSSLKLDHFSFQSLRENKEAKNKLLKTIAQQKSVKTLQTKLSKINVR